MIDVHAHVVLPGVMGCAGDYGPELGVGPEGRPRFRVGNYVLDGVDYTGTPFMDPDVRLRGQRPPRHRAAGAVAQSDHVLPPHRSRDRDRVLPMAQRRARRGRRRPPRPVPRVRPAPDAGHRRRDRSSCGGRSRTSACSAPTSAPTSRPTSTTSASTRSGRRRRARRPGVHPPRTGGHRRTAARPADPQVRPRPLARLPVRGDAGDRLLDLRRRARPPPRRSTSACRTAVARRRTCSVVSPIRAAPGRGPVRIPSTSPRRCAGCGSTTTSTTTGRWRCSATRSAAIGSCSAPTSPAGTRPHEPDEVVFDPVYDDNAGGCCASTSAEVRDAVSCCGRRRRSASAATPGRTAPARRGSRPT